MKQSIWIVFLVVMIHAVPTWGQGYGPVIKDGKEWLQPAAFVNQVSWNEVDAVCPAPSRVCTGVLGDYDDVTGYTFASLADIDALMATYGLPPVPYIVTDLYAFSDVFDDFETWSLDGALGFAGWFANSAGGVVYLGVTDSESQYSGVTLDPGSADPVVGVWLYRAAGEPSTATSIPTMSIYGLMITAIGLLLLSAWRLSKRRVK